MAINPLPSLIAAAARDVGNRAMAADGRDAWSAEDAAASVRWYWAQVGRGYRLAADVDDTPALRRFALAIELEAAGELTLRTAWSAALKRMDAVA